MNQLPESLEKRFIEYISKFLQTESAHDVVLEFAIQCYKQAAGDVIAEIPDIDAYHLLPGVNIQNLKHQLKEKFLNH